MSSERATVKETMVIAKRTTLLLLIILSAAISSSAQTQSKTYPDTRRLLIDMVWPHANEALKKLFEEGDVRRADLVQGLFDPVQNVSLNAQSIIKYLADPDALADLEAWYEYRRTHTKEYWISPVELLKEVKYLNDEDRDLAKLVLKNLHPNEKDVSARMVAFNKRSKTALIEVVFGEIFTEGWHVVIRQEGGKWRLLSNYLVWQS